MTVRRAIALDGKLPDFEEPVKRINKKTQGRERGYLPMGSGQMCTSRAAHDATSFGDSYKTYIPASPQSKPSRQVEAMQAVPGTHEYSCEMATKNLIIKWDVLGHKQLCDYTTGEPVVFVPKVVPKWSDCAVCGRDASYVPGSIQLSQHSRWYCADHAGSAK